MGGRSSRADAHRRNQKLRRLLAEAVSKLGGRGVLELRWGGTNVDAEWARRWCWIEPWILLSQDEDLFLLSRARFVTQAEWDLRLNTSS